MINLKYDTDPLNQKLNVIVCAPSGVAAKAIGGRTLHNAFNLPIERDGQPLTYEPLKGLEIYIRIYKF